MSDMNERNPSDAAPATGDLAMPTGAAFSATAAPPAAPANEEDAPLVVEAASDFKQLYTLLFCCSAIFIATMWLPIEGRHLDLYAKDSISGGFLAVFSAYGVFAGWMNIHNRKMIVWPAFFAAAAAIYLCTMRAMQLIGQISDADKEKMDFRGWVHVFGSGYYVISLMSLLVMWTLLTAVMSGAKKEAARKEASKSARASKKI